MNRASRHAVGLPSELLAQIARQAQALLHLVEAAGEDAGPGGRQQMPSLEAAVLRARELATLLDRLSALSPSIPLSRLEELDLALAARAALELVPPLLRGRVSVQVLVDEAVTVLGDRVLIEETVAQLVTNAIEAVAAERRPRVVVHVYASTGLGVVSVRDNGPGIAPERHRRVFEPFFSTKPAGASLGLGLSLCVEHARRMGGNVILSSRPGKGASFRLYLTRS